MRETVIDWLTSEDTFYLLGAGCSYACNKPGIGDITNTVLSHHHERLTPIYKTLKPQSNRNPTVEEMLNYLLKRRELCALTDDKDNSDKINKIDHDIASIKNEIVDQLKDDWTPASNYDTFLRRIAPARQENPRDLFILNYDTLVEATLEYLMVPYQDGFVGNENAYFEPALLRPETSRGHAFNIYKLHGSINWERDGNGFVRRRPVHKMTGTSRSVVVYPSEQKYVVTRYGIYETMLARFRDKLRNNRPNTRLVILGYSFNDEHINEAIIDALQSDGNNLTVIAFVGPEEDMTAQHDKLKQIEHRSDGRFNAYVGGSFCLGNALDLDDSNKLLSQNLWRFENLAAFLGGS